MELLSKDYNYLDFIIGKIKWQEKVFDCTGGKVIEVINIRKIIFPNADLSYFSYGTSYRSIQLNGYGIEQIILKYKDQKIVINEKKYMVIEENPTVTFHVGKHEDGGAVMSILKPICQRRQSLHCI